MMLPSWVKWKYEHQDQSLSAAMASKLDNNVLSVTKAVLLASGLDGIYRVGEGLEKEDKSIFLGEESSHPHIISCLLLDVCVCMRKAGEETELIRKS